MSQASPEPTAVGPRIVLAPGARAAEQALLRSLGALCDEAARSPACLARPVRVVVPSQSLRQHVCAALVRARGGGLAGVQVQTLHALALEILERAGEPAPLGEELFPVVVRQVARDEPVLRAALDDLSDGYGPLVASVNDLLDAGFEAAHAEGVLQSLEALGSGPAAERARAIVRVAVRALERMAAHGAAHRSALLALADDRLRRDADGALPARAVLVHGFADATGRAADLLESLVRQRAAVAFLQQPPDPSGRGDHEPFARFGRRLRERLEGVAPMENAPDAPAVPPAVGVRAPGAGAEVRAVADRVRALLDAGEAPESIGIVARDLAPYGVPLRAQLTRLGIPFSGGSRSAGPQTPAGRRLGALVDLLETGETTPADRWLQLVRGWTPKAADLRLALHMLGAGRLCDAADLEPEVHAGDDGQIPLPVRAGLIAREDDEDPEAPAREDGTPAAGAGEGAAGSARPAEAFARRRRLPAERLRRAVDEARALVERLRAWPDAAPLAHHREELEAALDAELRGLRRSDAGPCLGRALDALARLPGGIDLSREDFLVLMRRASADEGRAKLGGEGAGVQVLSVTEARGRTFAHLFLIGLERERFPRPLREDGLLPDAMRRILEAALPDIPLKERGGDEERFLFAQLLSAAEHATLCWQRVDEDGRERNPSPLLERLRRGPRGLAVSEAPSLHAGDATRLRPAGETALLAGLHGAAADFRRLLPAALEEAGAGADPELAEARLRVLAELDPSDPEHAGAGPYLGFVGPAREAADLRGADPYVTTLESLARCPWQTFLQKALRIEPPPDALEHLPDFSPLLIGSAVHAALEQAVRSVRPDPEDDLARALGKPPIVCPWPDAAELDRCAHVGAVAALRDAGVALPGFAGVLARRIRGPLDRAGALLAGAARLVGPELSGSLPLEGALAGRHLRFRVDRVDREADGVVLTDYKTGKKAAQLPKDVHLGKHLQAVAYALAGAALTGGPAVGRYLNLHDAIAEKHRVVEAPSTSADLEAAFQAAARTLLSAWDAGVLPPRLVQPGGDGPPDVCQWCEVRAACLQGDSGARMRLRSVGERAKPPLRDVWWLAASPDKRPRAGHPEDGS